MGALCGPWRVAMGMQGTVGSEGGRGGQRAWALVSPYQDEPRFLLPRSQCRSPHGFLLRPSPGSPWLCVCGPSCVPVPVFSAFPVFRVSTALSPTTGTPGPAPPRPWAYVSVPGVLRSGWEVAGLGAVGWLQCHVWGWHTATGACLLWALLRGISLPGPPGGVPAVQCPAVSR